MRKNILIIGVTKCDPENPDSTLKNKFTRLSEALNIYVLGRGKGFGKDVFGVHFYLSPASVPFVLGSFCIGVFLCMTKKIDVIVSQSPLTEGFVCGILSIIFDKELIVEVHGDWREAPFLNKKRMLNPAFKLIAYPISSFAFRRADKIRCVAEYFEENLKKRYPNKKYFVFPTYSDISLFFNEKNVNFNKSICTAAILSPIKSIDTLIKAFSRISRRFENFNLVIIGDGPSKPDLELRAHNLQLEDRVIFTGKLRPEEVKDIMKDCFVFVLPSLSEGLPRVLLEAMALGKPVIGSNVGGILNLIKEGENGMLFSAGNDKDLASKMTMILGNESLRKRLGENGRKLVESKFSVDSYVNNYRAMIYA